MKKIVWIVFILGLACGAIFSSSLNILLNSKESVKIEKKEVKPEVKEEVKKEEKPKTVQPQPAAEPPKQPEAIIGEDVKIVIQSGNSSDTVARKLFDAKLIQNKSDFNAMLNLMKVSSKLRTGEKVIKRGSSMVEIINIITN